MENENANLEYEEVVSPQTIEEMDEEAFDAYIKSAKESDGEVQADHPGEAEPAKDNAENEPYMSFATKEELQEYQDRTIGSRLKEIRETGARERESLAQISQLAKARYETNDDFDAMARLMNELEVQQERGEGSPDKLNVSHEMQKIRGELDYQRHVEDIQNDWIRQGEALKKIVPDFDLEAAFENSEFYRRVVEGQETIAEAYPILQKKPPRRAIPEIGNSTNGVAGHISHDVKSMSDHEFDDYIKRLKNG